VAFITSSSSDGIYSSIALDQPPRAGNVGDHRLEIEIAVGDVEEDDAVALDRPAVDRRALGVRRCIGTASDEKASTASRSIELFGCRARLSRRSPSTMRTCGAHLIEEGEAVAGDVDHRRIDLEEGPALVGRA
jgi:hypothetical protein